MCVHVYMCVCCVCVCARADFGHWFHLQYLIVVLLSQNEKIHCTRTVWGVRLGLDGVRVLALSKKEDWYQVRTDADASHLRDTT